MQSEFRDLHQRAKSSAIGLFHLRLRPGRVQKWLQMRPTGGFEQQQHKSSHSTGQEILLSKKDEQWIHLPAAQRNGRF